MKLAVDIDGVLRDLGYYISNVLGHNQMSWGEGSVIFNLVAKKPSLLVEAPPTVYLDVIRKYLDAIILVSTQPIFWRPYTSRWLEVNFPEANKVVFVKRDKKDFYKQADYIIEDSPKLDDYSNVLLINYEHNKKIEPYLRIKNAKELDIALETLIGGKNVKR